MPQNHLTYLNARRGVGALSHLLYANNVILFCHDTMKNEKSLASVFKIIIAGCQVRLLTRISLLSIFVSLLLIPGERL